MNRSLFGGVHVQQPCADKYNLYSEFISNNPYAKSMFFEELRKLPKRYTFVDPLELEGIGTDFFQGQV